MTAIKLNCSSKVYLIAKYLESHSGATSAEIAKGIGGRRGLASREAGNICSRHPDLFTMTRVNKGINVYSLNEGVEIIV